VRPIFGLVPAPFIVASRRASRLRPDCVLDFGNYRAGRGVTNRARLVRMGNRPRRVAARDRDEPGRGAGWPGFLYEVEVAWGSGKGIGYRFLACERRALV